MDRDTLAASDEYGGRRCFFAPEFLLKADF